MFGPGLLFVGAKAGTGDQPMNRLERRVSRLEGDDPSEPLTLLATAPYSWPEERREAEVRAMAIRQGVEEPFNVLILGSPPENTDNVEIGELVDLGALIEEIQNEGRRIDQR